MARDRVCGMEINEASALHKSYLRGQPYYFCSAECKQKFDRDPEQYGNGLSEEERSKTVRPGLKSESQTGQPPLLTKEGLMEKTRQQTTTMVGGQKAKAAEGLDHVARALRRSSKNFQEEDQSGISRYADQIAEKIERASEYIRQKDVNELVGDAEQFVKSQPALAFGGAFAIGFIVARFLKSSSSPSVQEGVQRAYG